MLKAKVGDPEFVLIHSQLTEKFGNLKEVEAGQTVVEGTGTPPEWVGVVHATLKLRQRSVPVVYEFHRSADGWRVYGFK